METKITEKYSYLTDIITSYSGREQRIKLRDEPRHYVSFDYSAMNVMESIWLRALARDRQDHYYYMPFWNDGAYLASDFLGGHILEIEENFMLGFYNTRYCLFFNDDYWKYGMNTVKRISSYQGNTINLEENSKKRLYRGVKAIIPMRKCVIQPSNEFNYVYSQGTEVTLNFEDLLEESDITIPDKYFNFYPNEHWNEFNMPETYEGRLVFLMRPTWHDDDSNKLSIGKSIVDMDTQVGLHWVDLKNRMSYDTHTIDFNLLNRESINNIKLFFSKVSGMYKSFYMPSWVTDFVPCDDIKSGSNLLPTKFQRLHDFFMENPRKKKIIVFTKDRKSYIYDVLGYTYEDVEEEDGEETRYGNMILTKPFDITIPLDNILMISYFNLVRFNSDDLTIDYSSSIAASTTLSFMEVDDDQ